jgi:hypothetical protein
MTDLVCSDHSSIHRCCKRCNRNAYVGLYQGYNPKPCNKTSLRLVLTDDHFCRRL